VSQTSIGITDWGFKMRTTAEIRRLWDPPCEFEKRSLTLYSGATLQGLNAAAFEAFQALDGVMRTFGYVPRANSPGAWETGAYNCRKITNGKGYRLHAFGIAADINARTNPYGKALITEMPLAMVAATKAVGKKTKAARVAFQKASGLGTDGVCGPLTWRAILI
jgi:hypothetical protein